MCLGKGVKEPLEPAITAGVLYVLCCSITCWYVVASVLSKLAFLYREFPIVLRMFGVVKERDMLQLAVTVLSYPN